MFHRPSAPPPINLSLPQLMQQMENTLQQSLLAQLSTTPWNKDSLGWSNLWPASASPVPLAQAHAALEPFQKHLQNPTFQRALKSQLEKRDEELNRGLEAFAKAKRPSPPKRVWAEKAVWQLGTTRLLYHPPSSKTAAQLPVFLVPSLVNRWYVLDLLPKHSLVEWLAAQGHPVYILDWDSPGEEELTFGFSDYVTRRLIPALQKIHILEKKHIHLFGYCMGGVLALAGAQHCQSWLQSLILLATPWDFSAPIYQRSHLPEQMRDNVAQWIESQPFFAGEWLDQMFYMANPWAVHVKYRQFPRLKAGTDARKTFIAIEDWVHDGVAMPSKVARECIVGWGMENRLRQGKCMVMGQPINPTSIQTPTLLLVPRKDAVVPESAALALEKLLPEAYVEKPNSGHVSLLIGPQRHAQLYAPLKDWLQFTQPQAQQN